MAGRPFKQTSGGEEPHPINSLKSMVAIVPSKLRARERTQAVRQAHTRKLGAHINVPSKNVLHIFHTRRSKYRRVLVKCCIKEILCADFEKLEGTLTVAVAI